MADVMRHRVSIVNHKGGVGKTTSAVNIAAALGELGRRVLVIDLDPQGSASVMLGVAADGEKLLLALQRTQALPVTRVAGAGIDLVAAGPELVKARQRFTGSLGAELLRRCLTQTAGDWEWIVIDCPPSLGILTHNALLASTEIIIPVETNFLAFAGINQMMETIRSMQSSNRDLALRAVIPCRVHSRRKIHQEFLARLNSLFPGKVAPAVRENVALAEAPAHGQPVLTYAPGSNGASDYRQVTRWLAGN
ncbi:MAG: ParA family protein [Desulfurivibrio sp.]|nr:MAG: ParA family protein [Desulfurivibrio sp.]